MIDSHCNQTIHDDDFWRCTLVVNGQLDADGLSDGDEAIMLGDPYSSDTDGDNILDSMECEYGSALNGIECTLPSLKSVPSVRKGYIWDVYWCFGIPYYWLDVWVEVELEAEDVTGIDHIYVEVTGLGIEFTATQYSSVFYNKWSTSLSLQTISSDFWSGWAVYIKVTDMGKCEAENRMHINSLVQELTSVLPDVVNSLIKSSRVFVESLIHRMIENAFKPVFKPLIGQIDTISIALTRAYFRLLNGECNDVDEVLSLLGGSMFGGLYHKLYMIVNSCSKYVDIISDLWLFIGKEIANLESAVFNVCITSEIYSHFIWAKGLSCDSRSLLDEIIEHFGLWSWYTYIDEPIATLRSNNGLGCGYSITDIYPIDNMPLVGDAIIDQKIPDWVMSRDEASNRLATWATAISIASALYGSSVGIIGGIVIPYIIGAYYKSAYPEPERYYEIDEHGTKVPGRFMHIIGDILKLIASVCTLIAGLVTMEYGIGVIFIVLGIIGIIMSVWELIEDWETFKMMYEDDDFDGLMNLEEWAEWTLYVNSYGESNLALIDSNGKLDESMAIVINVGGTDLLDNNPDCDNDGILDGEELRPSIDHSVVRPAYMGAAFENWRTVEGECGMGGQKIESIVGVATNPLDADTDGDGLSDSNEVTMMGETIIDAFWDEIVLDNDGKLSDPRTWNTDGWDYKTNQMRSDSASDNVDIDPIHDVKVKITLVEFYTLRAEIDPDLLSKRVNDSDPYFIFYSYDSSDKIEWSEGYLPQYGDYYHDSGNGIEFESMYPTDHEIIIDVPDDRSKLYGGCAAKITIIARDYDAKLGDNIISDILDIDGVSNGYTNFKPNDPNENSFTFVIDLTNGYLMDPTYLWDEFHVAVDNPVVIPQGEIIVADGRNAYGLDPEDEGFKYTDGGQNVRYDVRLKFMIHLFKG